MVEKTTKSLRHLWSVNHGLCSMYHSPGVSKSQAMDNPHSRLFSQIALLLRPTPHFLFISMAHWSLNQYPALKVYEMRQMEREAH